MAERREELDTAATTIRRQMTEQDVINALNRSRYNEAFEVAKGTDIPEDRWRHIESAVDRHISPEYKGKEPLTIVNAESGLNARLDDQINDYGMQHNPFYQDVQSAHEEARNILDELSNAIDEAQEASTRSKMAKVGGIVFFPIIAPINAIVKGRRVKKSLAKINELHQKYSALIGNDKELNKYLQPDKISPNKGQISTLSGDVMFTGSLAAAPFTGMISLLGLIPSTIAHVAGGFRGLTGIGDSELISQKLGDLQAYVEDQKRSISGPLNELSEVYRLGAMNNLQNIAQA